MEALRTDSELGSIEPSEKVVLPSAMYTRTVQEDHHDLLGCRKVFLKNKFFSSPIVVAGAVMSIHYRTTVSMYGGFPIVLAEGPTETGKSTAMKAGLSLLGMSKTRFYVEGTSGFFYREKCHLAL